MLFESCGSNLINLTLISVVVKKRTHPLLAQFVSHRPDTFSSNVNGYPGLDCETVWDVCG